MSYTAQTFNVMIASPGDVASERAIIRDVIYEWNAIHSNMRKIVLLPIAWESHSSPDSGSSAQGIINSQLLTRCDLLVGVFWTRIGTPTESFASGTVEEIEKHIATGRPAMLYFSSAPVALEKSKFEQFEKLEEFKESMRNRSLYEGYEGQTEFKDKFFRQLQLKVNDHSIFQIGSSNTYSEIAESKTTLPKLTNESRILLKEASLDKYGQIIHMDSIGGTSIQSNGKNFIRSENFRETAKWKHSLEELIQNELIVDSSKNGEVFTITNLGFQIADMIEI